MDTNIYGLGEVVASSGFRRAISAEGGTLQTMWARDIADPVDENMYVVEGVLTLNVLNLIVHQLWISPSVHGTPL